MNYGEIITGAFWIALRNPALWFFGFFVGGASFSVNFPANTGDIEQPGPFLYGLQRWITENLVLFLFIVGGVVVVAVLVAGALWLLSQGALIDSVVALQRGERRGFPAAWRGGVSFFWRVAGLQVLLFFISLGLLFAVGLPAGLSIWAIVAVTDSVGLRIFFTALAGLSALLLLLLLFVPLYIIGQLALRELIAGGRRIFGSLKGGYGLFVGNPGKSLLVWVIQVALMLAVGAVVGTVSAAIAFALFAVSPPLSDLGAAVAAAAVLAGLVLATPFIVISAIIGTFNSSYWTLAYLQLAAPQEQYIEE